MICYLMYKFKPRFKASEVCRGIILYLKKTLKKSIEFSFEYLSGDKFVQNDSQAGRPISVYNDKLQIANKTSSKLSC